MLEGKRIILRPMNQGDAGMFLRWFNNPEITQYLLLYLPVNQELEEKWIKKVNLSNTEFVFVIEIKGEEGKSNVPIGNCGMHGINWKDRNATGGIAIAERGYWGNGFGTETLELLLDYCFKTLNMHRVSSSVFDFNSRSLKMHEKLGFTIEGIRREAIYKNGKYHDEIILGLLKREWNKKK